MARSPKSDGSTFSYVWCSPDELDFSYTSFMESDVYDYDYDDDYDDDYDYSYNYDYGFDTHPELTDLIISRKYFATRVPFRSDGNPRGKFPRKPLPWPASKLSGVQSYEQEAKEYRNRLWHWEVELKRKQRRNHDPSNMPECIPEDLEAFVSSKTQDKIINNGPKSKKDRRDGPATKKVNKKKARNEKRKAQKVRDKKKPRFEKPHYLLALEAMHRKKGCQKVWVGCPICNKIMAEWDGVMKNKSRDLATRRQDGLWEARNGCVALDIFDDDRSAFPGCDCGSSWLGAPIDPDYDRAHVEMRHVVDYVDSLGWETFRVKYVDRIGRGTRRGKEVRGLDPVQEKEEVEATDVHMRIPEGTEDTDSINLSHGGDTDTSSEEWDLLDNDSVHGCSEHADARPDTVKAGKDTSRWATYMGTQRSGRTTNWILGRWFG